MLANIPGSIDVEFPAFDLVIEFLGIDQTATAESRKVRRMLEIRPQSEHDTAASMRITDHPVQTSSDLVPHERACCVTNQNSWALSIGPFRRGF